MPIKILAENKKAFFNYQILETFEAGIVLKGHEVKAALNGKINITGAYVTITKNEVFLINATIGPYQSANLTTSFEPTRSRKLLLNRKEINYLTQLLSQKGLTLIPLKVYIKPASKKNLIKLEFGLAKGKRLFDKRETIKKRDIEKKIRQVKLSE
ncbi:MAG: SsrA-binding protein [Parcubacteria group bacterium ADurb.Bin305]|jgi:SsrA-binding protein|nr:SsrA-binding protein SmpB [Candidatus Paceibacterota bacterium]MDD3434352.1 SsrA-binding protein SmpB [Candidatus Paceibacterota bacterium]OQA43775.1 MAG: SsrA-binding protein [Parcubacteria group bacterium ADurb.Bin305]